MAIRRTTTTIDALKLNAERELVLVSRSVPGARKAIVAVYRLLPVSVVFRVEARRKIQLVTDDIGAAVKRFNEIDI